MAELLKNIYNLDFFHAFTNSVKEVVPDFSKKSFLQDIYDNAWNDRALKQRMRHITLVLNRHLAADFITSVDVILKLIPVLKKHGFKPDNLEFIFLPDFIEYFGTKHYRASVIALEEITQFVTCEFAVRPFILQYPQEMMEQMLRWSNQKHDMVRRLASEGCRPRLPWAMAIPALKKDPGPIIPILENLKDDSSSSVRRSVANNLNDISKDHPEIVIDLVKRWKGQSKEKDDLCKHACRTLLKQGNQEVMELFGFGTIDNVAIRDFKIGTRIVRIGESLEFSFRLINANASPCKIRLEYGIYYQKANGSLSKKVYKISERVYSENSSTEVLRKQSFRIITTRKLHPGQHRVSIIINGKELKAHNFELSLN